MTLVLGIDPSLTSTGFAVVDTVHRSWITERVRTKPGADRLVGQAVRMRHIADEAVRAAWSLDWAERVDLVVIEGLAVYGRNAHAGDLAGLWWHIISALTERDFRVEVVAPATRAKYAAGSGRASKSDVLAAVRSSHPLADVPGHDIADAVALAALGARRLGLPVEARECAWSEGVVAGLRW